MGSLDVAQRGRTEAAKAAGYSATTAAFQASRLLKNVKVKRLIAQLTAAQNKKLDISVERTLEQIARHAYVDPRALFNDDGTLKKISELDADTAACIAGVQMGTGRNGKRVESIKITNQLRALEMLGNYLKLFAEHRNPVDLGVEVIIMDAPRPPRPVAAAASTQLSLPDTRSDVIEAEEYVNAERRHPSKQARLRSLSFGQ